jgi:hypothetical protein
MEPTEAERAVAVNQAVCVIKWFYPHLPEFIRSKLELDYMIEEIHCGRTERVREDFRVFSVEQCAIWKRSGQKIDLETLKLITSMLNKVQSLCRTDIDEITSLYIKCVERKGYTRGTASTYDTRCAMITDRIMSALHKL